MQGITFAKLEQSKDMTLFNEFNCNRLRLLNMKSGDKLNDRSNGTCIYVLEGEARCTIESIKTGVRQKFVIISNDIIFMDSDTTHLIEFIKDTKLIIAEK